MSGRPAADEKNPPTVSMLEYHPVTFVEIAALLLDGSPRSSGEDPEHMMTLAAIDGELPPIIVQRSTMRVIDGVHRVRAAQLKGRTTIEARLVECDEHTAFVLAVQTNVTHGLPLSQQDRKSAAAVIMRSHPQWSDRVVASSTGLSDKTVRSIRTGAAIQEPDPGARLGRDGKLRPVNSAARRLQAAELLREHPAAALREIARATGLSAATVRDVRSRTDRGEDPVPARYREPEAHPHPHPHPHPFPLSGAGHPPCRSRSGPHLPAHVDRETVLDRLRRDPSMRFNEAGRTVLRRLYHSAVDSEDCRSMGASIPPHWAPLVADLARSCARAWTALAEQLDQSADEQIGRSSETG